jgi:hypothetical protein
VDSFLAAVRQELELARRLYPRPFASAHEGESVIREEFSELVAMVRKKPAARDPEAMRAECVQVAAMAMRFAEDLCETGRVNGE